MGYLDTNLLTPTTETIVSWSSYLNKVIIPTATRSFTSDDGGLTGVSTHTIYLQSFKQMVCADVDTGWIAGLALTGKGPLGRSIIQIMELTGSTWRMLRVQLRILVNLCRALRKMAPLIVADLKMQVA